MNPLQKPKMNPLDGQEMFPLTLANPNPTSGKNKQGAWYRVAFELTQEEWQQFMDAECKGMVIECMCQVTHRNDKSVERDPNTVDAFEGKTDKESRDHKDISAGKDASIKGGPLSVRSDRLARDESFYQFIVKTEPGYKAPGAKGIVEYCRVYIRDRCNVESRAELDHDKKAADKFKKLISSYIHWATENGYDIA